MKNARLLYLACLIPLFCFSWSVSGADGPKDPSHNYYQAYVLYQDGTKLVQDGKPETAIAKFKSAREIIDRIRTTQPAWQPDIVKFRLKKIDQALEGLSAKADGNQPD